MPAIKCHHCAAAVRVGDAIELWINDPRLDEPVREILLCERCTETLGNWLDKGLSDDQLLGLVATDQLAAPGGNPAAADPISLIDLTDP